MHVSYGSSLYLPTLVISIDGSQLQILGPDLTKILHRLVVLSLVMMEAVTGRWATHSRDMSPSIHMTFHLTSFY